MSNFQPDANSWTVADSARLYNVAGWGEPYFAINQLGNVTVSPSGSKGKSIELLPVVESLIERGVSLPLLIRFPNILADRLARLHQCMAQAIARYEYRGKYQGVFPIKCNQNRQLIESVIQHGLPYQLGLEVGSKPELAIALALLKSESHSILMCNGYKDREYLETALLATKLGHKPIIVIEQLPELALLLEISQELDILPTIGVRAKLSTKGIGRWGNSTGDRAKFGLTVTEILQVVRRLKQQGCLNCLNLLHFHIGSQISAIGTIKNAIREASQIYVQLVQLGAQMHYLNVGGGLAIDYDGSKTNTSASKNYNMQNYANDIVAQIRDACDRLQVPHPTIVSESARAISAHQSVLIFDILSESRVSDHLSSPIAEAPLIIKNFWETYRGINSSNLQESYHDAIEFHQEALSLFNLGYLSLIERSHAEELYWACCRQISAHLQDKSNLTDDQRSQARTFQDEVTSDLASLSQIMASTYYANLSIFRSVPDSWAIKQLFPVMPIHRLKEKPSINAILADITCDSDGTIDRFIGRKTTKPVLELHPFHHASPYYLGLFLAGAYQEIMGNLHNLFGNTNVVQIDFTAPGEIVETVIPGDSIETVLNYLHYNRQDLIDAVNRQIKQAKREQHITMAEAQKLLSNYHCTLNQYTYLKH